MKKWIFCVLALSVFFFSCKRKVEVSHPSFDEEALWKRATQIFKPIPASMPGAEKDTKEMIELGKKLYFDPRLSKDNTVSCNTCHLLDKGKKAGVDNLPVSKGVGGKKGPRNAPTVWNAGFHIAQFWDGRAKDLVEQAKGPILNPLEMAMPNEKAVIDKLKKIPEYVELFKKAFPKDKEPLTYHNLARAIAAFERTLITKDRFDDYLKGDKKALTAKEKEGLALFMDKGCITCHKGSLLGGDMFQKIGLVNPYPNKKDLGRYEVTKKEEDKFVFKVPSLRNVALTAPYFHDGSVATLEEAVRQMAWLQLGKKLTDKEVESIVAFLKALTGKRFSK